jgi:hypothetical protein
MLDAGAPEGGARGEEAAMTADWMRWDALTWQAFVAANWLPIAIGVAAVLVLLFALAARASRPAHPRYHEFSSAMPDRHPVGSGLARGQVLPDRRAEVLQAIDDDYATGRIDRIEWERRRREL